MSEGQSKGLDGLELDVAIIGAGVGGLYALYCMREKLGLNVQSFDMASGVGGTWYWNRYPGCRVDTEFTVYTYSFDLDMFQNWHWSERYARQSEVLAYMNAVADKHHLKRSINFNARIDRAAWDDASNRWVLTTSTGATVRAALSDRGGRPSVLVLRAQVPRSGQVQGSGSGGLEMARERSRPVPQAGRGSRNRVLPASRSSPKLPPKWATFTCCNVRRNGWCRSGSGRSHKKPATALS